ncbi:unnamed protein product [Alopecurus aequalis]
MDEEGGRRGAGPNLGPADLISTLPEDLLFQILGRLRCARAAARTSLLSRRWRGLWTGLPDLIFCDVAPGPLLSALTSLQATAVVPGVSYLDIHVPGHVAQSAAVSSLLHAAARLSPAGLNVALRSNIGGLRVDLPLFDRATSIELHGRYLCLRLPQAGGDFRARQKLSLSGCSFDVAALVLRCPCLRVLRVARACLDGDNITIRSASLRELAVETNSRGTDRIDVEAPMLKQLSLSLCTTGDYKLSVSIVAPIVLLCYHGCWNWFVFTDEEYNFMHTIKEHLITDFSVLELYFMTRLPDYSTTSSKHVFGAFVLHLLGVHRIRSALQKLKIVLMRSEVKEECPANCSCDEPKDWRSKNFSLINLAEVEIEGFFGDDHEFDFLKVIFKCAPVLKRMVVRMLDEVTTSNDRCMKMYDIFKANPFVECKLMQCLS